jgi:hypothetical protein
MNISHRQKYKPLCQMVYVDDKKVYQLISVDANFDDDDVTSMTFAILDREGHILDYKFVVIDEESMKKIY